MNAVGIDWGSSSLRAYLFDSTGQLLEQRESDQGITRFQHQRHSGNDAIAQSFEKTLLEVIKDWHQLGMQVLLSGMITSRNGWIETPYLPCPARPADLYAHAVSTTLEGLQLKFLPGVCQKISVDAEAGGAITPDVVPDVMRGEELQLFAIAEEAGTDLLVLPGTHSKWAQLDAGAIAAFRTIPTGELFEVLLNHSLIGGLALSDDWNEHHFLQGVASGHNSDVFLGQLFSCRSSVLLEAQSPTQARAWLSGLLIGRELREGMSLFTTGEKAVRLIGNEKLCGLYQRSFAHLDIPAATETRDAAQLGYQRILQSLQ